MHPPRRRGGEPVTVRAGDEEIGVPQLVPAAQVVLSDGVAEAAGGSPGGHVDGVGAGGGGEVAEAVSQKVVYVIKKAFAKSR